MKFRGVLVKALEAQQDRDGRYIDPAGVRFDPDLVVPIYRDFHYDQVVGHGRISRETDGSLTVKGELSAFESPQKHLAIGIMVSRIEHEVERARNVVTDCSVMSIAVTERHADLTQPWIEIE
jgi:hypothetical protein